MKKNTGHKMNCLICNKSLKSAFEPVDSGSFNYPPCDAVVCTSYGNYGSSVWDPIPVFGDNLFLEFYICDKCLVSKAPNIYKVTRAKVSDKLDVSTWKPN